MGRGLESEDNGIKSSQSLWWHQNDWRAETQIAVSTPNVFINSKRYILKLEMNYKSKFKSLKTLRNSIVESQINEFTFSLLSQNADLTDS